MSENSVKCSHENRRKERMNGMQTGDYICRHCGECLTPAEVKELERKEAEIKMRKPATQI
jgi:hypothetical protein